MSHLNNCELTDSCEAFLSTLFSGAIYTRWKRLKLKMNFEEERSFVSWLLESAEISKEYKGHSETNCTSRHRPNNDEDKIGHVNRGKRAGSRRKGRRQALFDSDEDDVDNDIEEVIPKKYKKNTKVTDSLQGSSNSTVVGQPIRASSIKGISLKAHKSKSDKSCRPKPSLSLKRTSPTSDSKEKMPLFDEILSGMSSLEKNTNIPEKQKISTVEIKHESINIPSESIETSESHSVTESSNNDECVKESEFAAELEEQMKSVDNENKSGECAVPTEKKLININEKENNSHVDYDVINTDNAIAAASESWSNTVISKSKHKDDNYNPALQTPEKVVKDNDSEFSPLSSRKLTMAETSEEPVTLTSSLSNKDTKKSGDPNISSEGSDDSLLRFICSQTVTTELKISKLLTDNVSPEKFTGFVLKVVQMCKVNPIQMVECSMPRDLTTITEATLLQLCILTRTEMTLASLICEMSRISRYSPNLLYSVLSGLYTGLSHPITNITRSSPNDWNLTSRSCAVRLYAALCRQTSTIKSGENIPVSIKDPISDEMREGEGVLLSLLKTLIIPGASSRFISHYLLCVGSVWPEFLTCPLPNKLSEVRNDRYLCAALWKNIFQYNMEDMGKVVKGQIFSCLSTLCGWTEKSVPTTKILLNQYRRVLNKVCLETRCGMKGDMLHVQDNRGGHSLTTATLHWIYLIEALLLGQSWTRIVQSQFFKCVAKKEINKSVPDGVSLLCLAILARLPNGVITSQDYNAVQAMLNSLLSTLERKDASHQISAHIILTVQSYEKLPCYPARFTATIREWVERERTKYNPLPAWLEPIVSKYNIPAQAIPSGGEKLEEQKNVESIVANSNKLECGVEVSEKMNESEVKDPTSDFTAGGSSKEDDFKSSQSQLSEDSEDEQDALTIDS